MNYFMLFFSFISLFLSLAFRGFSLETQEMDLINNLNGFGKGIAGIYKHAEKRRRVAAVDSDSGSGSDPNSLPCLNKLLPCHPYLKSPSPPPTCCVPLNEVVKSESQCLCKVFTDPEILKGFNLTLAQAMELPKNCGINVDTSECKQGSSPGASPTGSPSTPGSSGGVSSNTKSTSNTSATMIDAAAAFWLVASVLALIFSVF